jgi:hypothetical protein
MKGMSSHQSTKMINDEWLTPPEIIQELGPFDTDPCSPIKRPWSTATTHYTIEDNGLLLPWHGFVWYNPPYSREAIIWIERLAIHNNGIALIFARTETDLFHKFVWPIASSVLFIKGRLWFRKVDGTKANSTGGAPSVLIGYGPMADNRMSNCKIRGKYIKL